MKFLTPKGSEVNWTVCPALEGAEGAIAAFYAAHGMKGVVTSAKDGKHSENSRHYWKEGDPRPAEAIDLRTRDFADLLKAELFCSRLLTFLNAHYPQGGKWAGILHTGNSQHLHLEWSKGAFNIVGYTAGKSLYKMA